MKVASLLICGELGVALGFYRTIVLVGLNILIVISCLIMPYDSIASEASPLYMLVQGAL